MITLAVIGAFLLASIGLILVLSGGLSLIGVGDHGKVKSLSIILIGVVLITLVFVLV